MADLTVYDFGEYALHDRVRRIISDTSNAPFGPGDDACVIPIDSNLGIAVCTDIVPNDARGRYAGRFAVIHNFADLLAIGSKPIGILLAIGAPNNFPLSEFDMIIRAAAEEAKRYQSTVLGGDTKERPYFSIVGTGVGLINLDSVITRSGARPNDIVAVTNTSSRGWGRRWSYQVCKIEKGAHAEITRNLRRFQDEDLSIPFAEMLALRETNFVTAGIDCSDGLISSAMLISKASGVGIQLDINLIDHLASEETEKVAYELGLPKATLCFNPGYDWECLLTIKSDCFERASFLVKKTGGALMKIGTVIESLGVTLLRNDKLMTIPSVGDMKFAKKEDQHNSPSSWLKYIRGEWVKSWVLG